MCSDYDQESPYLVWNLTNVLAVLPVTSCEAERSISTSIAIGRLKTSLRSVKARAAKWTCMHACIVMSP